MKKSLALLVSLALAFLSYAQHDTLNTQDNPENNINSLIYNSPLLKIKGEWFHNYPSSDFMEAVNGLFPDVFSFDPNTDAYLFVINGFILPDVNGISLQDIEEVVFVKSAVNGMAFPLIRAGTFYVTLKKTSRRKPLISFNAQHNTSAQSDFDFVQPLGSGASQRSWTVDNRKGSWQQYHLSVSGAAKKLHYLLSVQQIIDDEPRQFYYKAFNYGSDTSYTKNGGAKANLRLMANLQYQFNQHISAEVFSHYSPTVFKTVLNLEDALFIVNGNDRQTIDYFSGGVVLHWKPLINFRNDIRAEYSTADGTEHLNYKGGYRFSNDVLESVNQLGGYENHILIQNSMLYSFNTSLKIKTDAGLDARWFRAKENASTLTVNYNNGTIVSDAYTKTFTNFNFGTISPHINVSLNERLFLYGRYAYMLKSETFKNISASSRSQFFAAVKADLKKIFHQSKSTNLLELNINYADFVNNTARMYWLPDKLVTDLGIGIIYPFVFNQNQPLAELIKTKLVSVQLSAGALNNHIRMGIDYNHLKTKELVLVNGLPGSTIVQRSKLVSSFSLFGNFKVICKDDRIWIANVVLNFPENKPGFVNPVMASDYDSYQSRISLQNYIRLKRFYFTATALAGTGRYIGYLQQNGLGAKRKISEWVVNYLVAGYEVLKRKDKSPGLSLYIQSKNLLSSKGADETYRFTKTIGVGINIGV